MMTTRLTDEQTRTLATITTRDDAGRHFTENFADAEIDALEAAGMIEINRPVHERTGIPYDRQHWSVEVTEAGREYVEVNQDQLSD